MGTVIQDRVELNRLRNWRASIVWIMNMNRRLYYRLRQHFPHVKGNVAAEYPAVVGGFAEGGRVILDVGGGARCAFANECAGSHIIAVDISASELQKNQDVADRKVADVTQRIPVPDNSADIVSSRYVLEHLKGADRFAIEAFRVLKPGGVFITLFPNKYAPFSVINRILPVSVARRIAYALKEQAAEFGIFPAYYERCSPRAFRRLLESEGFTAVNVRVAYSQSSYFNFFLPLALAVLCYEWMICRLNLESLAAHVLVCAHKPK
jgi:ubiquinone/menaquinone biosynthesis C-methylase UbiE